MILRVTKKIGGGEITFPSIPNQSYRAGRTFNVDEQQFYSTDIQDAISGGYVTVENFTPGEVTTPRRWKVTNISGAPFYAEDLSLDAGKSKFISEEELYSTTVQNAIAVNWLKAEEETTAQSETKNKPVAAKKLNVKLKKKSQSSATSEGNKSSVDGTANMVAWNAESQTLLNKEDATNQVAKKLNMEIPKGKGPVIAGQPDALKTSNVDGVLVVSGEKVEFSEEETEDKSQIKKAQKGAKPGRKSRKVSSSSDTNKNTGKGKSLTPVGRKRPSPTADDSLLIDSDSIESEDSDIGFVDQEEVNARMQRHPRLRNNSEVDLG